MSPATAAYREFLDQLESMTTHDGFVSTLIDIRDTMLFYDRDLMVAGYTGTLEALIVSLLATAVLESDAAASEAFAAVRKIVDELPARLTVAEAAVDVQAVVETFLRGGGWVLRDRVAVYTLAFSRYLHGDYDMRQALDPLVARVHRVIRSNVGEAMDVAGEVGALMLRGQMLRPRWLSVAEPRLQLWLAGLRNLVGHLAGNFDAFPWGPAEEERRRQPAPRIVVDLQNFRKRRTLAMDAWRLTNVPEPRDHVDRLLERIFEGPERFDRELLQQLRPAEEEIAPLLMATVDAPHLLDPQNGEPEAVVGAIRALAHLQRHEVVPRLIELLTDARMDDRVTRAAREALEQLGGLAVDGMSEYVRRCDTLQGGATLAGLLARMPRSEKTFRTLVDLFQRLRWEEGKLAVAAALAEYGDGRAVPLLQQALRDPQLPTGQERKELEGAVRRLRGPNPSPAGSTPRRRVATKG